MNKSQTDKPFDIWSSNSEEENIFIKKSEGETKKEDVDDKSAFKVSEIKKNDEWIDEKLEKEKTKVKVKTNEKEDEGKEQNSYRRSDQLKWNDEGNGKNKVYSQGDRNNQEKRYNLRDREIVRTPDRYMSSVYKNEKIYVDSKRTNTPIANKYFKENPSQINKHIKYDKYDKQDKYDKYDKYDRQGKYDKHNKQENPDKYRHQSYSPLPNKDKYSFNEKNNDSNSHNQNNEYDYNYLYKLSKKELIDLYFENEKKKEDLHLLLNKTISQLEETSRSLFLSKKRIFSTEDREKKDRKEVKYANQTSTYNNKTKEKLYEDSGVGNRNLKNEVYSENDKYSYKKMKENDLYDRNNKNNHGKYREDRQVHQSNYNNYQKEYNQTQRYHRKSNERQGNISDSDETETFSIDKSNSSSISGDFSSKQYPRMSFSNDYKNQYNKYTSGNTNAYINQYHPKSNTQHLKTNQTNPINENNNQQSMYDSSLLNSRKVLNEELYSNQTDNSNQNKKTDQHKESNQLRQTQPNQLNQPTQPNQPTQQSQPEKSQVKPAKQVQKKQNEKFSLLKHSESELSATKKIDTNKEIPNYNKLVYIARSSMSDKEKFEKYKEIWPLEAKKLEKIIKKREEKLKSNKEIKEKTHVLKHYNIGLKESQNSIEFCYLVN